MRIAKIVAALCVVLVLTGCGTTQTITKTVAENTVTQYVPTIIILAVILRNCRNAVRMY